MHEKKIIDEKDLLTMMSLINKKGDYLLCVRCMTYNHSEYIKDALDGFCMQRTSFPFYVVVFDDASTDGEQEVIKSYMEHYFELSEDSGCKQWETEEAVFVFARHKENENCHFLVVYLKKNLYKTTRKDDLIKEWCVAKYIALCEGDDYWTDPLKLQKQVDFLEGHEDFSICFHEARVFNQAEGRFVKDDVRKVPSETDIIELAKGNYIHTMTVVYRNNSTVGEDLKKVGQVVTGDYVSHMLYARYGRIKKLPDNMAVYRLNQDSVWGTKDDVYRYPRWNEMLIRIIPFFEPEIQDILHEQYMWNCNQLVKIGEANVRSTKAYRLGKFILNPFGGIKKRKKKGL